MRRTLLAPAAIAIFLAFAYSCARVEVNNHSIGFYNVENLFDTINDPGINDGHYTPESSVPWNTKRYNHKLDQLARVISAMDTVNGFPIVVGLSEVENESVVRDLAEHGPLKEASYSYIHKDSPDERGIDVAMLYQPSHYLPLENNFIRIDLPDSGNTTRDILYSKGLIDNADTVHLFFNHWVSRWGGQQKTEPFRILIANKLKHMADSIMAVVPDAAIIIAGDLNDNPTDTSVMDVLGAALPEFPAKKNILYNLSLSKFNDGQGSLYYKSWDMFDQVIVSSGLLSEQSPVHLISTDQEVVRYDWMLYKPENGPARPSRTASGKSYYGGFSDHLPVMVKLAVRKR